jgi:hypothetical protein
MDNNYWNQRYLEEQTGWDIGYPSTPLKEYIDQLSDKNIRILIPGCGNAYEGEYLHQQGFTNVTLADFAEESKTRFLKRVPTFPKENFIVGDFFELKGQYDLILEQTFFCAIDPKLRNNYAKKMRELLTSKGKLVGVLFNLPDKIDGPPFGGSIDEYQNVFSKYFTHVSIKPCYNSIKPREGNEVFITVY